MKWTSKLPTEPGWYFYHRIDGDFPVRVGFVVHKTYTAKWSMDLFETLTLFKHPYEEFGKIIAEITVPMRWAGPIPEPDGIEEEMDAQLAKFDNKLPEFKQLELWGA